MEKYQITIKNRETGEILVDSSTSAIIGAIDEGKGTRSLCLTDCNPLNLAATCAGAMQAANRGMADLPAPIVKKIKKISKKYE